MFSLQLSSRMTWWSRTRRALSSSGPAAGVVGEVRSAHAINQTLLLDYLRKNVPGYDWSSLTLKQFLHGQSNPVRLCRERGCCVCFAAVAVTVSDRDMGAIRWPRPRVRHDSTRLAGFLLAPHSLHAIVSRDIDCDLPLSVTRAARSACPV